MKKLKIGITFLMMMLALFCQNSLGQTTEFTYQGRLLTGTRPEPTFLITKPFQRSTVKAAISQALFFDAATVPAA